MPPITGYSVKMFIELQDYFPSLSLFSATIFLRTWPALKTGVTDAGIMISSLVAGLMPLRSLRFSLNIPHTTQFVQTFFILLLLKKTQIYEFKSKTTSIIIFF